MDVAALDVVANDADPIIFPVTDPVNEPLYPRSTAGSNTPGAYDALSAHCDVYAPDTNDAVEANDDVPFNEPVNDPVNEPVLVCTELDTSPLGTFVMPV
jgi:hypothetical protein